MAFAELNGYASTVAGLAGGGTVRNASTTAAILTTSFASGTQTFSGNLTDGTGSAALSMIKTGGGTQVLSGTNTYTGTTTISGGVLELASGGTIANSAVVLAGGTFRIATGNTAATLANVRLAGGSSATSTLDLKAARDFTWSTALGSTSGNLAIVGSAAGASAKVVTLGASGDNWSDYGGAITVTDTALKLNGLTIGNNTGMQLTIGSGATLSGTGTVNGAVAVQSGGTLSVGNSPGTATFASLTLAAGSVSRFELGNANRVGNDGNGTGNDLVVVTGNLTLNGTLKLAPATGSTITSGYYRLFNFGASLTQIGAYGGFSGIVDASNNSITGSVRVMTNIAGQVNILYAAPDQSVLFFDGGDSQGNTTSSPGTNVPAGGTGTWSSAGTNWTTGPGGSTGSDVNDAWRGGVAVFAGDNGGTVTVSGPVDVQGIQFVTGGYTIDPDVSGVLNLVGDRASSTPSFIDVASGMTATVNAPMAGADIGVRKTGNGTLVLGGANTYTGATRVEAGTLALANTGALSGSSGLYFAGGNLRIDAGAAGGSFGSASVGIALSAAATVDTNGHAFTLAGQLSGSSLLTKSGEGTLTLAGDNSGFAGGITVTAGRLSVATASALGQGTGDTGRNTITLNGGTLRATDTFETGVGLVLSGTGNAVTVDPDKTVTLSGVVSGTTLRVTGAGTVALSNTSNQAPNTFSGLTVDGGAKVVNSGAIGGTIALDNGTLKAGAVQSLNNAMSLGAGGGTLDGTSFQLTYGGALTGSGQLTTKGRVVLTGSALTVYAGPVDVSGDLKVDTGTTVGDVGTTVTVKTGGTLGGGGTIKSAVTVESGGALSAGASPGKLTIENNLTLNAGSTSVFELGAAGYVGTNGTDKMNDLVVVTETLSLGGTLVVKGDGTNAPTSGYYRLFNYGSLGPGTAFGAIEDGNGSDLTGNAKVLTNVANQVNLLYAAGNQSVLFFTGSGNTAGNTGTTPGAATPAGRTGTWSVVADTDNASGNTQWTTAPTGSTVGAPASTPNSTTGSDINDGWRQGVAVFGGATGGTVTVSTTAGAVNVEGMQFITTGYTVTGDTLTLVGNAAGGGSASASFIRTESNVTATIGVVLAGAGVGFNKTGAGTLVLTGANTFTGAVTVSDGTLVVGNNDALGSAGLGTTAVGNTVTLRAGTRLMGQGTSDLALRQSITVDSGSGTATIDTNGKDMVLSGALAKGASGGTVAKDGEGDLTLSGDSSGFGGIVQVRDGSLTLTGSLTVSSLTVDKDTTLTNNGTLTGTSNTITNNGTLVSNDVLTDSQSIVNNGVLQARGTLSAPTVTNANQFTVTGNLFGEFGASRITTFTNSGSLSVGGNSFTGIATLNTSNTVSIGTGGQLGSAATGAVAYNQTAGTTTNAGTLEFSSVSISGGSFSSRGTVNAATAFNNAAAADLAGTLNAGTVNNSGRIDLTGALGGTTTAVNNTSGGVIALNGYVWSGIGTLTNTGTILGGGVLSGATLAGSGVIDLRPSGSAGLAQDSRLSLSIGQLTGNQTVRIALDPVAGTAGNIVATGSTAGSSLTFLLQQTTFKPTAAPIVLARGLGAGTTVTAKAEGFTFDVGFVNTRLENPATGLWQVTTTVSPNAGAPAASIGSVITSLSTGFFSSTNAFVTSPSDTAPNTGHGGPWVRIQAGQYDTQAATTVSFGSLSSTTQTKVRTSFSGFQVGADYGLLNVGGSGVNLHGGFMAGSATANGGQQASATPTKGSFTVPFVGVYAALVKGAFSADLQYRHDFYTMSISNPVGFTGTLANQNAEGDSVNGSATYRVPLTETAFIEPSLGFNYTRVQVDPFKAAQGNTPGVRAGTLSLQAIESLLGRASLRAGFTTVLDDKIVMQPFVTAAVWHEFADAAESAFTFTDSGDRVKILTGRVGTFGQAGLGVTSQLIGTSLLGYIRADARFGDRIRGGSINMGVRYDF